MDDKLTVIVRSKQAEAEGIVSLELVHPDGLELPQFGAGAHIDIALENGLTRQYSLCNAPHERHRYLIAVLREPQSRGGSLAVHDNIRAGQAIRISRPRNLFPLAAAPSYLLLAGGIGITPLLAMAEQLASEGAEFQLHYCVREPARAAFTQRMRSASYASRVHFYFDSEGQQANVGALLQQAPAGTHLYVCGPAGFIELATAAAHASGWPAHTVHREYFAAPASAADATAAGEHPFDVQIASSGKTYRVGPEQSVIQALAQHGICIPVSCEQGVCGTCITGVLSGHPDHRDMYFSEEEHAANDRFTPCCSRSRGPLLVLDL